MSENEMCRVCGTWMKQDDRCMGWTCSPECARVEAMRDSGIANTKAKIDADAANTTAIVDALDRLTKMLTPTFVAEVDEDGRQTVRPIRSVLSVEIGEALDDPHNAVFNKRSEPKRL